MDKIINIIYTISIVLICSVTLRILGQGVSNRRRDSRFPYGQSDKVTHIKDEMLG